VSRLRTQLEERTVEANENARILKTARSKLAKHTQRTVVQTRRQTERVVAARHSADLEALAKQSSILKSELKNMQHKDWVMECARLEGMLQEAFKIVQHVEAQRAESIEHQEEMRVAVRQNEQALEAEVAAHHEERKRAAIAEKERDVLADENRVQNQRITELDQAMIMAEKAVHEARTETAFAETQLRTMRQYGVQKLQLRKLARSIVVWRREAEAQRLIRQGKHMEERLLREKSMKEDANALLQTQVEGLQGDVAARTEAAEETARILQEEVEEWRSKAKDLEDALKIATPALTQAMATEMTPVKPKEVAPTFPQRKPSLGSIMADVTDEQAASWRDVANVQPGSALSASMHGMDGGTPAEGSFRFRGASAPSTPAMVTPPSAATASPAQMHHSEEDAEEQGRASIRIQANYRGNRARKQFKQPVRAAPATSCPEPATSGTAAPFVPGSAVEEADFSEDAQDIWVECPEGMGPGSELMIGSGERKLNVIVPPGITAGQQFKVRVDSSFPSQPKVHFGPEPEPELGAPDSKMTGDDEGAVVAGSAEEHLAASRIQAIERGRHSRRDTCDRRLKKQQEEEARTAQLTEKAVICQAIRRGNIWRKRVAVFEKWDKTSGEIDQMVPKIAKPDEKVMLVPQEHLIIGEHYTPLGLRLARQLFLVFDRDMDDRLSLDELKTLNEATMQSDDNPLPPEELQELLLLFDSDTAGLTFGGFLDLYRMEDMDLAADCHTQQLSHARNIKGIPTLLPNMSMLPDTHMHGSTSPD